MSLNFIASIYDIFLRIKKNKKSKFEIIINERKRSINDSENIELIKREEEGSYFTSLTIIKNIFKKLHRKSNTFIKSHIIIFILHKCSKNI